ncbi:hypothetical protein [Flavobacterium sp. NRK1]|jgi:hypothetical protein|uniref:hypothetical protein n=1 Tax=Flavobacterium sp. NRK1 TaxID=2954929 RepID=UPI0020938DE8|nr:hypothetical protein [Flavobacterium sp. NRK1]MCO6149388.1 hypothetical protein [Flavobacterium sp. NRK1]
MKNENPISFITVVRQNLFSLEYKNLREFGQGGPVIGELYFNEKRILKFLFGGPYLKDKNNLYIPLFINNFFSKKFKIAVINVNTLKIKTIGISENLIWLYKIEDDYIYYYTNIDASVSKRVLLKF